MLKAGCDWGNMEDMFKDNEVAFIIQGPWAYGGIEASNVNFGHTVMPLGTRDPIQPIRGHEGMVRILRTGFQGRCSDFDEVPLRI